MQGDFDDIYTQNLASIENSYFQEQEMLKNKDQGLWYYEELELGFNYRMTEISAALGNSQLNRLDSFVEKRHEIAKKYDRA